ncbi:MAG: LytR C-terminal domain-containing protein, partial [Actinomycetota bacterium]|nr:LytR C-terminal domain-containing protein [Actinomycetota bacterium]
PDRVQRDRPAPDRTQRERSRRLELDHQRDRRRQEPKRTRPDDAVPDVYVEVYNNSTVSGLAGAKAALLQDAGWQVVGVDNWSGNIPMSTVYYPDGMADDARQLASVLGISRTHVAVAPMRFDRLTVILNADAA